MAISISSAVWLLTHFDFDPKEFTLLKDLWSSYCQYCQNTDTKKTFNNARGLSKNLDKRDEFIKVRKKTGTAYLGLKKKEVIYLSDDYED